MPEKPPAFVVNDRRKFTAEGEIREGYTPPPPEAEPAPAAETAPSPVTPAAGPAKVVTMPGRSTVEADDLGTAEDLRDQEQPGRQSFAADRYDMDGDGLASDDASENFAGEEELGPPPTEAETAAQRSAYQRSAREMDALLQSANPGVQAQAPVGFEHIVQSFYLSAIMAMGAGTEPGQKPRIDILGARQAIDMLTVLEAKTRGNLDDKEQRLLQGVTFELRMMFLELTNAIAKQAQAPPPSPLGRK